MTYAISFDGRVVPAAPGQTVAAALWAAGIRSWRTSRDGHSPRGLFCGLGVCFDCLVTIDGVSNRRACLVPTRADMAVTTQTRLDGDRETAGPTRRASAERGLTYEIAVIGAGPAGLAAAVTAARAGCRVALLDAGPRLGGQFWRHRDGDGARPRAWRLFTRLHTALAGSTVDYRLGAAVWFVEKGLPFRLHTTDGATVAAERIVLATGAYDRSLPFPGWDLPGVVTPGAAQALLKGSGVPVGDRVVVAGAGPFLLPVATGLLAAGVRVVGVYEAGDPLRYARRPGAVAGAMAKVREAAGYAAVLARHRVPYRTRHAVVAAYGTPVSSVDIARLDRSGNAVAGSARRRDCDALAIGYGFTPQLELPLALGCATRLDVDGNLVLSTGVGGQTSVPGVYAAGEVTGVGGAPLALVEGRLVGAVAALAAGGRTVLSDAELNRLLSRRAALGRFAAVMHQVHAPPGGWPALLTGDTLVCRCEEVPAGRIRAAVADLGATDARTVKLLCRPGMGWCQGRVCGYATAALTAAAAGRELTADDVAAFAHRPFAQPVRLGDLAGEATAEAWSGLASQPPA